MSRTSTRFKLVAALLAVLIVASIAAMQLRGAFATEDLPEGAEAAADAGPGDDGDAGDAGDADEGGPNEDDAEPPVDGGDGDPDEGPGDDGADPDPDADASGDGSVEGGGEGSEPTVPDGPDDPAEPGNGDGGNADDDETKDGNADAGSGDKDKDKADGPEGPKDPEDDADKPPVEDGDKEPEGDGDDGKKPEGPEDPDAQPPEGEGEQKPGEGGQPPVVQPEEPEVLNELSAAAGGAISMVSVHSEEGFPEGTALVADGIDEGDWDDLAKAIAADAGEGPDGRPMRARVGLGFDLGLEDADGRPVEAPVDAIVELVLEDGRVAEALALYAREEGKWGAVECQVLAMADDEGEGDAEDDAGDADRKDESDGDGEAVPVRVAFKAGSLGRFLYALVEQAPETRYSYDADDVRVDAEVSEDAGLPEGARLVARALEKGSEEYEAARAAVLATLELGEGQELLFEPYDVYFEGPDGSRADPEGGFASVRMFLKSAAFQAAAETRIAHVAGDGSVEYLDGALGGGEDPAGPVEPVRPTEPAADGDKAE